MPLTIQVNGSSLTLVHKFSNGISTATIPDVCKTPTPGGPVPTPYPNIAQSITLSAGTTTVKGDKAMAATKGSKFALSNGDQAGTLGGVKSNVFMKEATWILYSFDVKLDGANACRLTDPMYHNSENTVNLAGVVQQALVAAGLTPDEAKAVCDAFCQAQDEHLKTGEPGSKIFERKLAKQIEEGKLGPGITPECRFDMATGEKLGQSEGFLESLEGMRDFKLDFSDELVAPLKGGSPFDRGPQSMLLKEFQGMEARLAGEKASTIFDLVVERGGEREIFDAKFLYKSGGCDKWGDQQLRDARKLSTRGKPMTITPKGCDCPSLKKSKELQNRAGAQRKTIMTIEKSVR